MIVLNLFVFECESEMPRSAVLRAALKASKEEYGDFIGYQVQAVAIENKLEDVGLDVDTGRTQYMKGRSSYDIVVYGHVIDPPYFYWGNDE